MTFSAKLPEMKVSIPILELFRVDVIAAPLLNEGMAGPTLTKLQKLDVNGFWRGMLYFNKCPIQKWLEEVTVPLLSRRFFLAATKCLMKI
jgi:hypothetical protein